MRERDYTAWLGVRALGEAVTRTGSNQPAAVGDDLRSAAFGIGAVKGEGVTIRRWYQKIRQPILLAAARVLVSVSPQEGFLHQRTPLDSLGFDQPESDCRLE
jgi:ABC transporter substrate binding protein (PQQ-dependent alcohol dehydrogenase system)